MTTRRPESRQDLHPRVAAALAAAEIPPSKLGPARRARLGEEQALYFWILRRFGSAGRPSKIEVHDEADRLGLDRERALATLAREDLVHVDAAGEITVAYPFSGLTTAHRVHFPTGHEVNAMCAIDALGIAPMFEQEIAIDSRDPLDGEHINVELLPDGTGTWQPASAVVVAGVQDRQADSCRGCCPVVNFFASHENAERWLREHPEVRGESISMTDAIAAGRAVFGDVIPAE